jgi:hypothetical protein
MYLKYPELGLVSFILAKFTNALVKSRPLKEIGAEQVHDFLDMRLVYVDDVFSYSCSLICKRSRLTC